MYHFRKTRRLYKKLTGEDRARGKCPFCHNDNAKKRTISEHRYHYVVPNRTYYDIFEGSKVKDHLMIVPKRHVEAIDDFTDDEKLEAMNIIGIYERKGYSIYARGVGSVHRSVKHQHTHLIKLSHKKSRFMLYLSRPYMLIHK